MPQASDMVGPAAAPVGVPALYRRLDALLLAVLLIARLRIDTLADRTLQPLLQNDVARQPFLGRLLSPQAMTLLGQQGFADSIGLLLIVFALAAFLVYLGVAEWVRAPRAAYRLKLGLLWLIILLTVFAPSLELTLLRQGSGPASYSHDGGVIQTEATIDFLLAGRNPYVENYLDTPMAEWGIDEFRTALYHYPYLPWTFLFSAPFKLLADRLIGWYDQRFVYLLLFALTLLLLPGLPALARSRRGRDRPRPGDRTAEQFRGGAAEGIGSKGYGQAALLLVMLVGLNPIMGSDVIFGQNDSFVLAWIVMSLWLWRRAEGESQAYYLASAAAFGLACASKPTAWFLAPFYLLLLARPCSEDTADGIRGWLSRAVRRGWPALAVSLLVIGPYFAWAPAQMIDDVWGWSAGTSQTAYQIWGWGASNLTLAFGWVGSRFAYWPFALPELLVGLPLMAALLWRQWRSNTPGRACWSYAFFLLVFFFFSRFLNENYLGYILAFMALGLLLENETVATASAVRNTRDG